MKSKLVGIVALSLIMASCGYEQSVGQQVQTAGSVQEVSMGKPAGDGWVSLGDGVYKRSLANDGVELKGTYKSPSWLNELEALSNNTPNSQDVLASTSAMLSINEQQRAKLKDIIAQEGQSGITQLWTSIYAEREYQLQSQLKRLKDPISSQALDCSLNANPGPTSGGLGAKATAYTSCQTPQRVGAVVFADAGGQRQDNQQIFPNYTYASAYAELYGSNCASGANAFATDSKTTRYNCP